MQASSVFDWARAHIPNPLVIPAKAGIQFRRGDGIRSFVLHARQPLDSRLRGNDDEIAVFGA
ncbi:hypothetical protein AQZ49_00215 [Novosphingobium sp. FSW06-99]|nr:hypothetical protein AQZ49_00215 [Novosphingobium sp. FSW06-99]